MAVDRAAVDPGQLRGIPLFADLSAEELGRAAELTEWIEVSAGETIGAERNFAYEFFVIEEGRAEVVRDGRRLAELGPGDFFGEIGLLVTGRRTASVVAVTPMRLIVMFEQSFRRLEKELPSFAASVRAACAERIQRCTVST
jgi:CRP/FNR family transcriptional regulator, cyclic AMP receptor protein